MPIVKHFNSLTFCLVKIREFFFKIIFMISRYKVKTSDYELFL